MSQRTIHTCIALLVISGPSLSLAQPTPQRPDSHEVIDLVVADWLHRSTKVSKDSLPLQPVQAILMDTDHVPKGYLPHVKSHVVIVSEWHPGKGLAKAGQAQYMGRKFVKLDLTGNGGKIAGPDRSIKISDKVLYLQGIEITGARATVKIATNLHHNQGGSGSTYTLRRGPAGWVLLPFNNVWIS